MNILVTGADGFLGREICFYLGKKGHKIKKLVRSNSVIYQSVTPDSNSKTFFGDITDSKTLTGVRSARDVDVLVHTAGLAHQFGAADDREFWKTNVEGTRNTAKLAVELGVKHFIHISSVAVYGTDAETTAVRSRDENSICSPAGIYAVTKLESEKSCLEILSGEPVALTILRPATIIGEEDAGNVFRLIKAIDSGRFIWIGSGANSKSLIYKNDVARAIEILIRNKNNSTEIFNVSAEPLSMKRIVTEIQMNLDKRILPISIPGMLSLEVSGFLYRHLKLKRLKNVADSIRKWMAEDVYSADKLFNSYGFKPPTDIAEALKREVVWYLERKS